MYKANQLAARFFSVRSVRALGEIYTVFPLQTLCYWSQITSGFGWPGSLLSLITSLSENHVYLKMSYRHYGAQNTVSSEGCVVYLCV